MNRQKSFENEEGAALYLVPTPIGNLSEMTPRALEALKQADLIACEDTRNSGMLLKRLDIKKPLISHHEFNQETSIPRILDALKEGKKIALISDAGYPVISDPGSRLVEKVIEEDIPVISLSGANAALNALVASGLYCGHYLFYGFLDAKSSKRKVQLESLKSFPYTMLFYEAPHRIEDTLKDMLEVLGDRKICLARELTKLYEEYLRGNISEVLEVCNTLKGEMVVVVEGAPKEEASEDDAIKQVLELESQGMKRKAACKQVAKQTGLSANELYQQLLARDKENPE